jgi:hypothetical protein
MLNYYFVIHSTVTKCNLCRLLSINKLYQSNKNIIIMRTLNSNRITATLKGTKSNTWNSKRRYR